VSDETAPVPPADAPQAVAQAQPNKLVVTGVKPSASETKAQLAARLAEETKAKADLAARVAAMEERETKRAADAKKAERDAAFAKHFDAAKIKAKYRSFVLSSLADLDPTSNDAAAKIDAFVKEHDEVREVAPLKVPATRWSQGSGSDRPPGPPRGADFAPKRERR